MKFSRYLCEEHRNIVDRVIQRNAYYAHPENVLICMLNDERKHIRELALRRLLQARQGNKDSLRKFVIPKLNFKAEDYTEMIMWADIKITEPPVTKNMNVEDLKTMVTNDDPENQTEYFTHLPCHTQAVERTIKLVTEASLSVCGCEGRDGFVKAKIASQKAMPKFETKKHFKW